MTADDLIRHHGAVCRTLGHLEGTIKTLIRRYETAPNNVMNADHLIAEIRAALEEAKQ